MVSMYLFTDNILLKRDVEYYTLINISKNGEITHHVSYKVMLWGIPNVTYTICLLEGINLNPEEIIR
jgi:hypothetical protein